MTADRPWEALLVLAAALLLWPALGRPGARRWSVLQPPAARAPARDTDHDAGRVRLRRWGLASAIATAAALLLGGVPGLVVGGLLGGAAAHALRARAPDDSAQERAAVARDLPAACDLLAVCLDAGLPVEGALESVGSALGGALGAQLRSVAALSRLGAEPRRAWADAPPELAALGRALVRAGESGAQVAGALRTLAAESRAAARAATATAVQRAAVWVLAPLGACFLPAFLCLGVAPMVLGIAGDVFG